MLFHHSRAVLAAATLLALHCARSPAPVDRARLREAASLVTRFITADTAGDQRAAETFVLPLGDGVPFCELATDHDDISAGAVVPDTFARSDTTGVVVAYHVIGSGW